MVCQSLHAVERPLDSTAEIELKQNKCRRSQGKKARTPEGQSVRSPRHDVLKAGDSRAIVKDWPAGHHRFSRSCGSSG